MTGSRRTLFGVILLGLCLGLVRGPAAGRAPSPEDEVRAVFKRFQSGVEAGDKTLGPKLAAQGPFRAGFLQLYDSLAEVYSKNRLAFPVEIGHLKILENGQAKVETYINPGRNIFVFTLVKEGGEWRFFHMEGILFPVFDVPALPASSVYTVPPDRVKWMMCERDVAAENQLYDDLKSSLGQDKARACLTGGGAGFKAAMEAWLPFLEGAAQFALFTGILEENYYGSKYTLTRATNDEAEIRFAPLQRLEVMKIADFWPKLSGPDYEALYRDQTAERARVCGLEIEMTFAGTDCALAIRRAKAR
jgi:hypothetical protein